MSSVDCMVFANAELGFEISAKLTTNSVTTKKRITCFIMLVISLY